MASIKRIHMRFYQRDSRGFNVSFVNEIVITDVAQIHELMDFGQPKHIQLGEDKYIPETFEMRGDYAYIKYISNHPKLDLSMLFSNVKNLTSLGLPKDVRWIKAKRKVLFTYILTRGKKYDIGFHGDLEGASTKHEAVLKAVVTKWLKENDFHGIKTGMPTVTVKAITKAMFSREVQDNYGSKPTALPRKYRFNHGTFDARMRDNIQEHGILFRHFIQDHVWKDYVYVEVTGDYEDMYAYYREVLKLSEEEVEAKIGPDPDADKPTPDFDDDDEDDHDEDETDVERDYRKAAEERPVRKRGKGPKPATPVEDEE